MSRLNVTGPIPTARGWLNSALVKEGTTSGTKYAQIVIFGGLTGNDDEPVRCNDMWLLNIECPE